MNGKIIITISEPFHFDFKGEGDFLNKEGKLDALYYLHMLMQALTVFNQELMKLSIPKIQMPPFRGMPPVGGPPPFMEH